MEFLCPEGYAFEGSPAISQTAFCHNWTFVYNFDLDVKCKCKKQPACRSEKNNTCTKSFSVVDCDCPPKFSNETAPGSYHSWNETEFDSCSDEEYTVGTEITYGCPVGHVFETEELLETQNMSLAFSSKK